MAVPDWDSRPKEKAEPWWRMYWNLNKLIQDRKQMASDLAKIDRRIEIAKAELNAGTLTD